MAKITITLEDTEEGQFKCVIKPGVKELMKISSEERTNAQATAILMLASLLAQSRVSDEADKNGRSDAIPDNVDHLSLLPG